MLYQFQLIIYCYVSVFMRLDTSWLGVKTGMRQLRHTLLDKAYRGVADSFTSLIP